MLSVYALQKIGSFSLIERVILSAGAMLIFSVSFQIDQMSEDSVLFSKLIHIGRWEPKPKASAWELPNWEIRRRERSLSTTKGGYQRKE